MRIVPVLVIVSLMAGAAAQAADPPLASEGQKTLYALGLLLSRSLEPLNMKEDELEAVQAGLSDGVLKRSHKVNAETYGPKIQELMKGRTAAAAAVEKKTAQAYLDKAAAEKGAKKTASGLIYSEIKPGTGPSPKETDKVKVHYHGTLTDGTVFDSSVQRGEPVTFALNGVIKCWTEGVQLMKVGGKSKLVCPADIAYGDEGRPGIKPGAALIFEVELLEIVK